jgi:hypothetical protein
MHQRQVAHQGHKPIRKMKSDQMPSQRPTVIRAPHPEHAFCVQGGKAIAPRVVQVSRKVVQQCDLDGRGRGQHVASRREVVDERQRAKLHGHAHGAHQVELAPTDNRAPNLVICHIHFSGSFFRGSCR